MHSRLIPLPDHCTVSDLRLALVDFADDTEVLICHPNKLENHQDLCITGIEKYGTALIFRSNVIKW